MKKTILTYGLLSGAVISVLMATTVPFAHKIGFGNGLLVGYTTMVLAFLLVFMGIRSYRDNAGNGHITFGRAFAVGICITLITCVCYVVTWEIIYYNFMPHFLDEYSAYALQKLQASGASAAAIQKQVEQMAKYKQLYSNPLSMGLMTFIEPFPVGLVITLVSAGILRKKPQVQAAQSAMAAS